MIWLNPERVTLGATELSSVAMVAIDRTARRTSLDWTDLGAFTGFADVPEQRVNLTIVRRITASETGAPRPGESLAFSMRSAASASAASVLKTTATVVVTGVTHAMSSAGKATQTIRAVAVSATGAADPIVESLVQGEV